MSIPEMQTSYQWSVALLLLLRRGGGECPLDTPKSGPCMLFSATWGHWSEWGASMEVMVIEGDGEPLGREMS